MSSATLPPVFLNCPRICSRARPALPFGSCPRPQLSGELPAELRLMSTLCFRNWIVGAKPKGRAKPNPRAKNDRH